MSSSIQNRLLGTTTVVLVLFLSITGWVLDRSFSASVVAGAQEQMQLVIYSLMGAVDVEQGRLSFVQGLPEPRLTQPESGLYAKISNEFGEEIWRSPSTVTSNIEFPDTPSSLGTFAFGRAQQPVPLFFMSKVVFWEDVDSSVVFSVATNQQPFLESIDQFRRSLWLGLGAATLLFIVAQLLALRWGLLPLRTMAGEVQALEAGERERLSGSYPKELTGLAKNLDRFVAHEQRSRTRYRNALEDLAHSLKTPLAVVRNALLDVQPDRGLLAEQLDRMETTVTHQLTKASATGPVVVGKFVALDALIERLVRALQTAYVERGIQVELKVTERVSARGDERDFLEILGNLLENAFKYTDSRVRVSVYESMDESGTCVDVEDDGPGIPVNQREEVLGRGRRLDEIESGQGIGLAVVAELVSLYQGRLNFEDSMLGGAKVRVWFPA